MKIQHDFHTVSAADLVRTFAACRDRAAVAPLFISNHGRNTHVLVGIDQFNHMAEAAPPETLETAGQGIVELADWMDDAVIIADQTLCVVFANRVAHAICRKRPGALNGRLLAAELPQFAGSLLEVHARRTLVSSEPSAADLPSPFTENAWLRFHTFPIGDQVVMILRDITDEVQRERLGDVKEALLQAMETHGEIGYVRISLRGTIEHVDQPFCSMLALPEARLLDLPIVDLVTTSGRPDFRAATDEVIRGGPPRRIGTSLLANEGGAIEVTAALAPLRGAYGTEGAVIVVTRSAAAETAPKCANYVKIGNCAPIHQESQINQPRKSP